MIFPTLYSYETGDFQQARQRTVKMSNYFQHLMKYKDHCFTQHSRFRYVAFNMLMRSRVKTQARYFCSRNSEESHLTAEELQENLESDNNHYIAERIARVAA